MPLTPINHFCLQKTDSQKVTDPTKDSQNDKALRQVSNIFHIHAYLYGMW